MDSDSGKVITFGKHIGKSYEEIRVNDISYISYISIFSPRFLSPV